MLMAFKQRAEESEWTKSDAAAPAGTGGARGPDPEYMAGMARNNRGSSWKTGAEPKKQLKKQPKQQPEASRRSTEDRGRSAAEKAAKKRSKETAEEAQ